MTRIVPGETIWLQAAAIIVASVLAVYFMIKQAREVEEMQKRLASPVKRITIISCGDRQARRPYKQGDYVGKPIDCPGGEGQGYIVGIYAEKEEKDKRRKARREEKEAGGIPTI